MGVADLNRFSLVCSCDDRSSEAVARRSFSWTPSVDHCVSALEM